MGGVSGVIRYFLSIWKNCTGKGRTLLIGEVLHGTPLTPLTPPEPQPKCAGARPAHARRTRLWKRAAAIDHPPRTVRRLAAAGHRPAWGRRTDGRAFEGAVPCR